MAKADANYEEEEIFAWYRQFSHTDVDVRFLPEPNAFRRVSDHEIFLLKERSRNPVPDIYLRFLSQVGAGYLQRDRHGRQTDVYPNCFMDPKQILELMSKTTGEWIEYPEFIDDDEIPFFDLGDAYVFTFSPKDTQDSAVWSPRKFEKISNSFVDFLVSLREDIIFTKRVAKN